MFRTLLPAALAAVAAADAGPADDITDALNAAIEAYEAGDVQDALAETAYATQLLNDCNPRGSPASCPPRSPAGRGRCRTSPPPASASWAAAARRRPSTPAPAGSFTVMMVADNPMVGAMAGMLGNAAVMASMGRIERINGESFLNANDELSGLIGGRVLIQASGASVDDMAAHLEQIDFDALADLGG
jgi:hypothetical protein